MISLEDYYKSADKKDLKIVFELWEYAKSVEPRASEGLSYGLPALKLNGRPLIGFSISKQHMSVYPFSPKIITALSPDLTGYEYSKGVIRFTRDNVITKDIIEAMIALRVDELHA